MDQIEQQLHGYVHGHQLLSSSVKLDKADQDVVDQLSDVAGPLRPGERFEPYLSFYPLPSRRWYVAARTWQDTDAPRAGCVRTRSALVPLAVWSTGIPLLELVHSLDVAGATAEAEALTVALEPRRIAQVPAGEGAELLEALFLEPRKPIAVFGSAWAEPLALRVVSAAWPVLRENLAVCTFALSPRTIDGRNFDLVFSPKDARSRFSDWAGRRIDGGKSGAPRHRWTEQLIDRVLISNKPSLGDLEVFADLGDGKNESTLRLALLWGDLRAKLPNSPNAALGLLDIAASRPQVGTKLVSRLEPMIVNAARAAVSQADLREAWLYVVTLLRKLEAPPLAGNLHVELDEPCLTLASRDPEVAVDHLDALLSVSAGMQLVNAIGAVLSTDAGAVRRLHSVPASTLIRAALASPQVLDACINGGSELSGQLADGLSSTAGVLAAAKAKILPRLYAPSHVRLASVLIDDLEADELDLEVRNVCAMGVPVAAPLISAICRRTVALGVDAAICDTAAGLESATADEILKLLVRPTRDRLGWLLTSEHIEARRRANLAAHILDRASDEQLHHAANGPLAPVLVEALFAVPSAVDLIERLLSVCALEPEVEYLALSRLMETDAKQSHRTDLESRALHLLLKSDIRQGRRREIARLLSRLNGPVDAHVLILVGLAPSTPGHLASENIIAFEAADLPARSHFLAVPDTLTSAILARGRLDLSPEATQAAARLLWDSWRRNPNGYIKAASDIFPFLLWSARGPASPLVAATFPGLYSQLPGEPHANDLFGFFGLMGWDRRKSARQDLVASFLRHKWPMSDLALAAARSNELERIFRLLASERGGSKALGEIHATLAEIREPWRGQIAGSLQQFRTK